MTVVGILSASAGLYEAIAVLASQSIDPLPLVARTIELDEVADALAGRFERPISGAPKIHVILCSEPTTMPVSEHLERGQLT